MLLFNRYEYSPQTDIAGRGEFSRVYKGVDTLNGEAVAIKIYRINDASDHYRAIQQAQTIRTFDHPALCCYLDIQEIEKEDSFGEKERLQVTVSSFMNAGNLSSYQTGNPAAALKKLLPAVLNGLSYLHKKGMIHGYIKPSNILVTETGTAAAAAITDFAMGIYTPGMPSANRLHASMSAIAYRSPEQLDPKRFGIDGSISFNTDLWSLALVVYEALMGEPMFNTADTDFPEALIGRITGLQLPEKIDALPAPFPAFLKLCLVKDASQRIKEATDLLSFFPEAATQHPAAAAPFEPSVSVTAEDDNTDDTRIIALPKTGMAPAPQVAEDDDTERISRPGNNAAADAPAGKNEDEDATQIIAKPVDSFAAEQGAAPENEGDDTMVIALKKMFPAADLSAQEEDATRIVSKPVEPSSAEDSQVKYGPNEEDTKIISKPGSDGQPSAAGTQEAPPVDQTIIISKVNKETQIGKHDAPGSNTGSTAAGNSTATGEIKPPDIIIRRREKPVVLFNRYEYLPASDLIGKGGFSRVYKAFDKKLSRWVALKIYKSGEFSDRYSPIAEIKRVVNLDHPNICRYLDIEEIENENPFGENEKIQVCVMELLDSGNFADYYKANNNPDVLKKLIQDILNGLSYLHKNGIIHRDIKPANILIKQTIEGPVAKITDFGISKNSDTENNNSSSALIVSIPYMAPEQLNAKRYGINEKVSFNLDIWSLGVTIYEVVTGKVLFKNSEQDNSEQIMANIMAPELPEKINDLPEPFRTIVSHCVIKNARERASKAEELMVLLHTVEKPADTAVTAPKIVRPDDETTAIKKQPDIAQKTERPKFSLTDPEENQARKKNQEEEKKKVNSLLVFIGSAVLIFILFIVYLKTGNRLPATVSNTTVTPTDSNRKPTTAIVTADTVKKNNATPASNTDTVAKQTEAIAVPAHVNGKKKETAPEEPRKTASPQKEKPAVSAANTAAKYVLVLAAEQDCTLKVNSINYGEIQTGKPLKIYLAAGKYILQFISSSNSASTYTANIEVKPENLGHADKFKIPLK